MSDITWLRTENNEGWTAIAYDLHTHYGDTAGTKKSARDLGTVQWLPADLSLLPIIQQELA